MAQRILIGTAGWNIRRDSAQHFAESGTHLARYAARFQAVEINSSFYRPHRTSTYARWADSVPSEFRFSVKLPKQMTHELRLNVSAELMEKFLAEVAGLGEKLGCVLVQLPPSLDFDPSIVASFLTSLRNRTQVAVVCEPRMQRGSRRRRKACFASITSAASLPILQLSRWLPFLAAGLEPFTTGCMAHRERITLPTTRLAWRS